MLIPVKNVLSAEQLERCRQLLQEGRWEDGQRTAGAYARAVKANEQLVEGSEASRTLVALVLRALEGNPLFISAALPRRVLPPKFNRYTDGNAYGAHVDGALMRRPDDGQTMRCDLSATLFLAEPEDYDGGELQIDGPFGVQSVKLPAGDLVLYPASSLHQVTPVTRGTRLASFCWIESFVRDDGARALLFELDGAIQTLGTSLGPTNEEVRRLSGIYHNLLRRWTST